MSKHRKCSCVHGYGFLWVNATQCHLDARWLQSRSSLPGWTFAARRTRRADVRSTPPCCSFINLKRSQVTASCKVLSGRKDLQKTVLSGRKDLLTHRAFGLLLSAQLPSLFDHLLKLLNPTVVPILLRQSGHQMRQCLQVNGFSQRFASKFCGQQSGGNSDAK